MDSNNDEALDIIVTNVVATFRTRCHLNLRTIALEGNNVIYKPEVGVRKTRDYQRRKEVLHVDTVVHLHTNSSTALLRVYGWLCWHNSNLPSCLFLFVESPDEAS